MHNINTVTKWLTNKYALALVRSATLLSTTTRPLPTMSDPTAIANEFVKFYYQTFDGGRQNLTPLYVRGVGAWCECDAPFINALARFSLECTCMHLHASHIHFCTCMLLTSHSTASAVDADV